MSDQDKINGFLQREDLSRPEQKMKDRVFDLDGKIAKGREELEKLREELQSATDKYNAKQSELLSLSQKLEGLLQLILDIEDGSEKEEATEEE